ncbi:MAG: AMP-binding protein [Cellvibrionales bacterium]|nr:AMP-binding protein [Cellvibrionales bacterium]
MTSIEALRDQLNVPQSVNVAPYDNLLGLYQAIISKHGERPAFTALGQTITYNDLDEYSDRFAAFLQQHTGLAVGDRIAIQLPNILQQPVVLLGAIKAGLVVVNTNPLYTEPELQHQFKDSGAKALVVLANVADKAAAIIDHTDIETVIVTELGDLHSPLKGWVLNKAVKYIKKMVPEFTFNDSVNFRSIMRSMSGQKPTKVQADLEDIAVLQYTGGTTGLSKGAMLTHANLMANALQSTIFFDSYGMPKVGALVVQPLPLYHIFAFTVSLICLSSGSHTLLIPNPRDLPSMVKAMKGKKVDGICALNTLFVALANNEGFKSLDFSNLQMTLSGGMALASDTAKRWQDITGCEIYEGYGLTETSPVVAVCHGSMNVMGSVGVVVPNTQVAIRDEEGQDLPHGERGELFVKGPQVMKGYWQHDEQTEAAIVDGWLATGDIALITDEGVLKIVDRKKDMILVSGFNVFPNEVEDVALTHPNIVEVAAIGQPDETSGEVVHLYVVSNNKDLTEADVVSHCRHSLAAYKVPKKVFFKDELPKSPVGKVLRRIVKEQALRA